MVNSQESVKSVQQYIVYLQVSEDVSKLRRQMLEELGVIVLLLDVADLLFVLHLAPRQLARHKLNDHVEQGPQVVMSTHLLNTISRRSATVTVC